MDLDQLKKLSGLKFQLSVRDLSSILARENELRTELDRLRSLVRETLTDSPEHMQARAIGADVIWMKWLGQTQRQLNVILAQVLAQKEVLMERHRHAHGRKAAAEKLTHDANKAKARTNRERIMQETIDHSFFR
jgi:hypothetical protein